MDNIIVAATNIYAFRAIVALAERGEHVSGILLSLASIASMQYHLLESAKHGMTGIQHAVGHQPSATLLGLEKVALNYDRVFAGLATAWLVYRFRHRMSAGICAIGLLSAGFMCISECQNVINIDRYPVQKMKILYMVAHSIWHIGAFHAAYLLASSG